MVELKREVERGSNFYVYITSDLLYIASISCICESKFYARTHVKGNYATVEIHP